MFIKVANQPKLILLDMNLPCCWVVNSKPQLHKIMLPIVKPHGDVPVVCPSDAPYFFAEHIHMLPLI
jgi:hypothetical protein